MQEEINLRDIVSTIWKGKVILAVFIIAGLLTGYVFSAFFVGSVYQTEALIAVSDQLDENLQPIKRDLNAFATQAKSESFLNEVLHEVNLQEKYKINDVKGNLDVETSKESTLINIKTTWADSKHATLLANMIAHKLAANIEITTRLERIARSNIQQKNVEEKINISNIEVDEATKQLQEVPQKLNTKKTLSEEPYLYSVTDSNRTNNKNLGALELDNEDINPVYVSIKSRLAEASINLSKLKAELKNIQDRIQSDQTYITELRKEVNPDSLNNQNIIKFNSSYNAVIMTPAFETKEATSNKILYFIALVTLFFMIGILSVFIKEYWYKQTK